MNQHFNSSMKTTTKLGPEPSWTCIDDTIYENPNTDQEKFVGKFFTIEQYNLLKDGKLKQIRKKFYLNSQIRYMVELPGKIFKYVSGDEYENVPSGYTLQCIK